jgi:hypothetical protein
MSDDPKEKERPAPSVEPKHDGEPDDTVPFVPYNDHSMNPDIYARSRWRPNAAALDTNNQVFPPLPISNRGKIVQYVDFGFTSAREFWVEVVLPTYECFKADPSRGKAIIASFPAMAHPRLDLARPTSRRGHAQQRLYAVSGEAVR